MDSNPDTPREEEEKLELPQGLSLKIPRLNVTPIVKERDEENSEAENANNEDKEDLYDQHFNELDLKMKQESPINTIMANFLLQLYSAFPPVWPIEVFVKIILMIQILSLVLSPLNVNWGFYGRYVLQVHTWIFLGGSSGPTLFHFSFFTGTFLSCSYILLTYLCFKAQRGQSVFAFLGLLLNLSPMLYIPTMIGSLSVIFKLVTSQTTPEDAYVYTFGVIGCLQAFIIFCFHIFYTLAYFEWRSSTVKENVRLGRSNNRFELMFYLLVTIMMIAYHFYIVLDYVTVSINMVVTFVMVVMGIMWLPYHSIIINIPMVIMFIQVFLASIIAFWTTIFNRTALSEVPLYIYLFMFLFSIFFGTLLPIVRILIVSITLRKRMLNLESSRETLTERVFPPYLNFNDFDIASRTMTSDDDILYTNEVYKWLRPDYRKSTIFHIGWANYLAFKIRSPLKAILLLDLVRHNYKSIDSWLLFLMQRAWFRENINYFTNQESIQIGLSRARQYEDEAKKLHLMFWYSVHSRGNLSHFFQKDRFIPDIVEQIIKTEERATELYSKIVNDGSSATVHHSYAMYCQNILGDLETADLHETHARTLEMNGEEIEEAQQGNDFQPDPEIVAEEIDGDSPRKEGKTPTKDRPNDSDSDVDNRYGLNYDEEGNKKRKTLKEHEMKDVEIKETGDETEDTDDDEKEDVFEKASGNIALPEAISLQKDVYGTPNDNPSKLSEVIEEEPEKKKAPIIPKLSLRKSSSLAQNSDSKGSAKSARLPETFRADILIPNDDELSLISGLSEADVMEDQNLIGANEKLTYKVMRSKLLEKTSMKNLNCCIFTPGILSILLIVVCYILVFIDLGIFSFQMVPIIAAGSVNLYANRASMDLYGAQLYASRPENGDSLSFDATMKRLKSHATMFQFAKENAYSSIGKYSSECTFQCELVNQAKLAWNSDNLFIQTKLGPQRSTLRDYTNQVSTSLDTISKWNLGDFSTNGNQDVQVVLQNASSTIKLLNTIQSNYININYGKLGLIFLLTIKSLFFLVVACIPFTWMLARVAEIRKNALTLYDIILSNNLAQRIFSSLKAKDMIRGDHYRQLSTQYFENKSFTEAFKKRFEATSTFVWTNMAFIIVSVIFMFAGLWIVYALNAWTYSFVVSDIRCSGERMIMTTNVHKMLLEIENGTTTYTLGDVHTQLDSLYYLHRAILIGNYSAVNNTGYDCAASEFRYTPQFRLYNSPRCNNGTVVCMSLNQLVTHFIALGKQLSVATPADIAVLKQIELEHLTPMLNASMNLYVSEGQFYADIMFNCLAWLFAINLCVFGLYSYGYMTPTLARIRKDIEISERMLSLVPIRFLTTDPKIRKFLNLQIFEQEEQDVEKAKKETEFYKRILETTNQPIILFERSAGQVLITSMNENANKCFECQDSMIGLPLITLFPNQSGIITRFIQSVQTDPKLFPKEIEIQGRTSSGKVVYFVASFGEVDQDSFVLHLKVQPKNLHDIIQDRDRVIKSLQLDNIPPEFRQRILHGENCIYQYVNNLTLVICEIIELDRLVMNRSDDEKAIIYNSVFTMLEDLAQEFNVHHIATPGNQFLCIGEVNKNTPVSNVTTNVAKFAETAVKSIHILNAQLPVRLDIRISIHHGKGMLGIRNNYREGEKTRFNMDIYGDIVTELESLLSLGRPFQILVSPEFYNVAPLEYKFSEYHNGYEMHLNITKLTGVQSSPFMKTLEKSASIIARDLDEQLLEL